MARPIELRDSANYLITAAHVGALLDEVNVIFRQVGLHFSVGAPLRVVENDQWAQYGLLRRDCGNAIRNIMSGTGGLEIYFVSGVNAQIAQQYDEPRGLFHPNGIIVRNSAPANTLAHEIGHACGWYDIIERDRLNLGFDTSALDGGVRREWLPNDWNNGTGGRFYDPLLTQRGLIARLLMCQGQSGWHPDISSGNVYGLLVDSRRSGSGMPVETTCSAQLLYTGGIPSLPMSH